MRYHVLFKDSFLAFRPKDMTQSTNSNQGELNNYLLFDFNLTSAIKFENFEIHPTSTINGPFYSSYASRVTQPKWVNGDKGENFNIALSSIISFAIGRPVKAPKHNYYLIGRPYLEDELHSIFPIVTAGAGAHDTILSNETEQSYISNIEETVNTLIKLPYEEYILFMQSIRLVHLAHLNYREDFALGFYLLISAIETAAQQETSKREKVKHEKLSIWNKLAKDNPDIKLLLNEYKNLRFQDNKSKGITELFINFILDNCPIKQWSDMIHPYKNRMDNHNRSYLISDGIAPNELDEEYIRKILKDCYDIRSKFTHTGENPPHMYPGSSNRYFDDFYVFDQNHNEYSRKLVPTYDFMSFLAYRSIINFAKSKLSTT